MRSVATFGFAVRLCSRRGEMETPCAIIVVCEAQGLFVADDVSPVHGVARVASALAAVRADAAGRRWMDVVVRACHGIRDVCLASCRHAG